MPRVDWIVEISLQAFLVIGLCNLVSATAAHQSDERLAGESVLLEQFLESRGLDRLLIVEVEMQLSRESEPKKQGLLIQRLGRLYQAGLLAERWSDNDPGLLKRAESLLRDYPTIAAEGLDLAIQHARYQRVERDFHDWWFGGRPPELRSQVIGELKEVRFDLGSLYQRLDREFLSLQLLPELNQVEIARKNSLLATSEGRISHCQYLLGWTAYFLGVSEDETSPWLLKSEDHFRRFLEMPAEGSITSIGKQWFDLETSWQFQALLGLAMVFRAKGSREESDFCFSVLEGMTGARSAKEQLPVWRLESMVLARQWGSVNAYIQTLDVASLSPRQQRGLWLATYRSSVAARSPAPGISDALLDRSVLGLLRAREFGSLVPIIKERPKHWKNSQFLGSWAQGSFHFYQAERGHGGIDLADQSLRDALEAADDSTPETDLARCQFLIASIDFRKGKLKEATVRFEEVARQLRYESPELASEAMWMQCRGLAAIAMSNPRTTSEAMAVLDRFFDWFPQSLYTQRVEFQSRRLLYNAMDPQQAISKLKSIPRSDVYYSQVQLEVVRHQYRFFKQRYQEDSTMGMRALRQLCGYDRELQDSTTATKAQCLRSTFWVLDAMLRVERETSDPLSFLGRASQLIEELEGNQREAQQLAYYNLRFAEKRGDQAAASQFARQLLKGSERTTYEKSALIYLAQNYGSAAELSLSEVAIAIADLRRLSEVVGIEPNRLMNSKNSRVTLFRLSEFYARAGQLEQADECLTRLIQVFPNRKRYLVALARLKSQREQFRSGLPLWRTLANGVEPGSELWYESKYELSRCLWKTGDPNARSVLQQTMHLSPQMSDSWTMRYQSLSKELEREH